MGENTEMILNGLLCQVCGTYMDDYEEPGYPRTCNDCKPKRKRGKENGDTGEIEMLLGL